MAERVARMKESPKRLWAARLLALVVMSVSMAVLVSMTRGNRPGYKKRVEIRANENIGQIVTAVEELGRDDIQIKTRDESRFAGQSAFLGVALGMFVGLTVLLAIYHTIYCLINGVLGLRRERDDTASESRLTDDFIEPAP